MSLAEFVPCTANLYVIVSPGSATKSGPACAVLSAYSGTTLSWNVAALFPLFVSGASEPALIATSKVTSCADVTCISTEDDSLAGNALRVQVTTVGRPTLNPESLHMAGTASVD